MDYDSVADELYALRPEEFTAARASAMASARTAGDRELAERIRTLRKPSLAAWVSNLLVRTSPGEVEPLLRLGEGLRQAHQDLDAAQLRELSRRQHALIRALSLQARQLAKEAGHPIGESVQREVENTLHAVLADPEAARAWAGGRLARPLSAAVGFPAVAEGARPRRPAPAPAPSRPDKKGAEQQRRRLAQAQKDAEAAERELRELRDAAATAGQEAAEAKQQMEDLQRRVEELADELERARSEHQQARFAERTARERARTADRQVREADRKATTAAAQLERLTSSDA
ncbi:hypothetical protein UK15_17910 [Streptomyces variegatus]|uniref:Uncharacterized protein n=1 Tax=Streptomyces variegatus TaxID=284040 RepID=A0A0M2GRW9_9ACTN|nr:MULTISPECIES: hypothetical protein [Streptomyces]KJK38150.1 hypothetical protein UK15_17910 [Streptomyces variegatus]